MMKENYKDIFKFIKMIAISLFLLIPIGYVSIMLALIYFLGILIFWGYCFYQAKLFKWYLITVVIIIGGFVGYMEYDIYQKEQARAEKHLIEEPIKYQETLQILNKKLPSFSLITSFDTDSSSFDSDINCIHKSPLLPPFFPCPPSPFNLIFFLPFSILAGTSTTFSPFAVFT